VEEMVKQREEISEEEREIRRKRRLANLEKGRNRPNEVKPSGRPKKKLATSVLADMRKVYRKPEGSERTEGQRALRKLLKENPKEFVQQLVRLEEAHAKKVAARQAKEQAEAASGVLPMDDGTARVLGLIEESLIDTEWKKLQLFFRLWDAPGEGCCPPGGCKWALLQEEARARGVPIPDQEVR
jgi:hypothetical protein